MSLIPRSKVVSAAIKSAVLAAGLSIVLSLPIRAAELVTTNAANGAKSAEVSTIQLRGRVVCLPEEMHSLHDAELPDDHQHIWGFKTVDDKFYTLLRATYSEALFRDERLRTKELILKVRLFPRSQTIEVASIHSLRGGVEHDLYYWCDICAIRMVSPQICFCCQGPVRLVEKPLTDRSEE